MRPTTLPAGSVSAAAGPVVPRTRIRGSPPSAPVTMRCNVSSAAWSTFQSLSVVVSALSARERPRRPARAPVGDALALRRDRVLGPGGRLEAGPEHRPALGQGAAREQGA